MNSVRKQRRTYIVDRTFQLGLIKKISILAIIFIVFSLVAFAITYHIYGKVAAPGIDPLYDSSKDVMDALSQHGTAFDILWPVMAVSLFVMLLITFVYGVILSHRMAGPLYRARQELKQLSTGTLGPDISLRKGDEFESLYAEVNGVKRHYREMVDRIHRAMSALDDGNPQDAQKELAAIFPLKDNGTRNEG